MVLEDRALRVGLLAELGAREMDLRDAEAREVLEDPAWPGWAWGSRGRGRGGRVQGRNAGCALEALEVEDEPGIVQLAYDGFAEEGLLGVRARRRSELSLGF